MKKMKLLLNSLLIVSVALFSCACASSTSQNKPKIISKDGAKLYEFNVRDSMFLMNPEEGSLLMKWNVKRKDGSIRPILHWDDNKVRGDITNVWGGAPIFFPFCGISFADGKANMWKTPRGEVVPVRKFGFIDNGKFEVVKASGNEIITRFIQTEETKKSYPFKYELYVHYKFYPTSYTLEMYLENKDDVALPWGPGHHPFIALPWNKGETCADYRIDVDAGVIWNINNAAGRLEPAAKGSNELSNRKVSGRIYSKLNSAVAKIGPKHGKDDVKIIFNDGKVDYRNCFVVFGIPNKTPYWALEPWAVPPLAAGKDAPVVPVGQKGKFKVEVKL